MRLIPISISILAIGCSTSPLRRPSAEQDRIVVSLDAHVHIESGRGFEDSLNNENLGHSFLISQSYTIKSPSDYAGRSVNDDEISRLVSIYPETFSGLCGANLSWPDVKNIVTKCLKKPGMIGVKIHDLTEPVGFSAEDKFRALKELLTSMSSGKFLILWHIDSDPSTDNNKLRKELKEIVLSASLNPNIIFVLAHAIDSLDPTSNLEIVVDLMQALKKRPENLYADLSVTTDLCASEPSENRFRLWKAFGFDYLLLGSDSNSRSWPGRALLEEQMSLIKSSPITDQIKRAVLIKNGLNVLSKVNLAAYAKLSARILNQPMELNEIKSHDCTSIRKLAKDLKPQ